MENEVKTPLPAENMPEPHTTTAANANPSDESRTRGFKLDKRIVVVIGIVLILGIILLAFSLFRDRNGDAKKLNSSGTLSFYSGDFKKAKEDLSKSLELNPKDPKTQARLIESIASEGNLNGTEGNAFKEGKKYADDAIKENPNDVDVLLAVGYLYETSAKYEEALQYYDKALAVDSNNAKAYFHKGHVLEFLNRQSEARDNYNKAYVLYKNDANITMAQAKIKLSEGNADQAIELFKQASQDSYSPPTVRSEALTNAAIIQRSQLTKLSDSVKLAKQAVDIAPTYSPALAEYGLNLFMNGDMTNSIAYMEKAISANPRIAQNYWRLGAFYKVGKNYVAAAQKQEEALSKIDDDNTIVGADNKKILRSMITYDLASTYSIGGVNDRALSNLNTAVDLNPNLKKKLKEDYEKFGDFKALGTNADFKLLIQ